ncbi:hypothetical protein AC1031_004541 [Aphanomyces cochlioides]|nr:hypothetical protein AC1031_004541 [Aphanomyces cochlioides]
MPSVNYNIFSSTGRTFYPEPAKATLKAKDSFVVEVKAAAINPVTTSSPSGFSTDEQLGLIFQAS